METGCIPGYATASGSVLTILLSGEREGRNMRAVLCHCRHRVEAGDEAALRGAVREHLIRQHPAIESTDEPVREIVSTGAYDFAYAEVHAGSFADDDGFGPEPF